MRRFVRADFVFLPRAICCRSSAGKCSRSRGNGKFTGARIPRPGSVPIIYLLLFLGAIARTFSWAARSSFFPTLVSRDAFSNAVTWNNSVFQIGSVVGPALSGFVVAHQGFAIVYAIDALTAFAFF